MSETDTMANNAVGGDSNGTSNSSNGVGDSHRARDSNRVGDSMANNRSNIRVDSSAIVGDLGNVAVGVVSVVVDVLDPAVGEVDRVGSIPEAGSIVGLGLLEGSARELVSHTVLVGVGGDLAEIVEPDSVGHRVGDGVHDRPGHGHGSSMHHRAGNSHGSSNSHTMANKTMSSHETMSSHKTMSSQDLRGSGGGGSQGRDAKEGLEGGTVKRRECDLETIGAQEMAALPSWLVR